MNISAFDPTHLHTILGSLNAVVYVADLQTYELLYLNSYDETGMVDLSGRCCWQVLQCSQDGPCPNCTHEKILDASGQPIGLYSWEFQNAHTGRWHQCYDMAIPWTDGKLAHLHISTDISDKKRADLLNEKTNAVLKMIATGEPAKDIYDAIALLYEARHPGLRCSMLTLKGDTLLHGGAPSLPKEYCRAVHGLKNGPEIGSCGTSTYTGRRVLVEDIATDPKWATLKDVALPHGLRSCWSEPIKDSTGTVMGAFGMYTTHPALPNDEELSDLESAARLAGIVMEREHREAQLRKLSNSLEQSGESVVITNTEGLIEYVNPAFTRLTGYSEEEAMGQNPCLLNSGKQDQNYYDDLWKTIASGKVWAGKLIDKKKDGHFYPSHLTVSPVKNRDGDTINYIGIQSDLSEFQLLEEQLRQAQKMEALGVLVGGIAHDFNNTLAGITGNLHLAKKAAEGQPKVTGKLQKAEKLAFQAAGTIRELLSFTRKGILQKHPLPIASFVREALKLHQVSIPENIFLDVDVPNSLMTINGDANQLQHALMNVVNNARDAVEGVESPRISIKLRQFCADSTYLQEHPYVKNVDFACISISDNGCGIDQKHRRQIFEPFFTTKGAGQGTGLGLSMVYGAIKSHDGHIEVSPAESGQGTTFDIYFPLMEETDASLPVDDGEGIISGQGETILLVDDNETVLETGKALLEELNYKVITAKDGCDAVTIYNASKGNIAALIIDVVMPKMGGADTLRILREENPEVKAIFCTGYDKRDVDNTDISSEVVLIKPFNINELSQKLKKVIG